MASNDNSQHPQQDRSLSVEDIEDNSGDNRTFSPPQNAPPALMTATPPDHQPSEDCPSYVEVVEGNSRDNRTLSPPQNAPIALMTAPASHHQSTEEQEIPERWPQALYDGSPNPPSRLIPLNYHTVGQRDLTQLYGQDRLYHPPQDFPHSFARGCMPYLPVNVRNEMGRLHPSLRLPGHAHPPVYYHRAQPAQAQARSSANQGVSPVAASSVVPRPPTSTHQRSISATPSTTSPAPMQPNTTTHPTRPDAPTAPTRHPDETDAQSIQRLHNIDINSASIYKDGTTPIPPDIQALADEINAMKKSSKGFPTRVALKELRDHFATGYGKLRVSSSLWKWYGDTRLFVRREWYYLVTEGREPQMPVGWD